MRKLMCKIVSCFLVITFLCGCSIQKESRDITIDSLIETSELFVCVTTNSFYNHKREDDMDNRYYTWAYVRYYWGESKVFGMMDIAHDEKLSLGESEFFVCLTSNDSLEDVYDLAVDESYIIKVDRQRDLIYSYNLKLNKDIKEKVGSLSLSEFEEWLVSEYGEAKSPTPYPEGNVIT